VVAAVRSQYQNSCDSWCTGKPHKLFTDAWPGSWSYRSGPASARSRGGNGNRGQGLRCTRTGYRPPGEVREESYYPV